MPQEVGGGAPSLGSGHHGEGLRVPSVPAPVSLRPILTLSLPTARDMGGEAQERWGTHFLSACYVPGLAMTLELRHLLQASHSGSQNSCPHVAEEEPSRGSERSGHFPLATQHPKRT